MRCRQCSGPTAELHIIVKQWVAAYWADQQQQSEAGTSTKASVANACNIVIPYNPQLACQYWYTNHAGGDLVRYVPSIDGDNAGRGLRGWLFSSASMAWHRPTSPTTASLCRPWLVDVCCGPPTPEPRTFHGLVLPSAPGTLQWLAYVYGTVCRLNCECWTVLSAPLRRN